MEELVKWLYQNIIVYNLELFIIVVRDNNVLFI